MIGPGGREHALVRALLRDPLVTEVHAAPGNAGIARDVPCHPVKAEDPAAVTALAAELGADLVVVGPEAPLAAGVADALRDAGVLVYGPGREAAELEASKAFAKQIMAAGEVPTAMAKIASTPEEAREALEAFGAPHVVKDDGLAAGKGVVVTDSIEEAQAHAEACIAAGGRVLIEEFLDGPEVSLFAVCDGERAVALEPAQDFKRIFDGDAGPNTGGMGAYTPLPWAPEGLVEEIMDRVVAPTLRVMRERGTPFIGTLFCGLALTSRGLRVIEFNVRFGDPETQAVLARLETPLGQLLSRAAAGDLAESERLEWAPGYAVDVVMAAENYPDTPRKGDVITGIEDAEALEGVSVLHAGTALAGQDVVAAGGRVLAVVGRGDTLQEARDRAYAGVKAIRWEGAQNRADIAGAALAGTIRVTGPVGRRAEAGDDAGRGAQIPAGHDDNQAKEAGL
ncbi:phosphoribosylamine--glycine ligase [Falsarthrobacter nasiphocae]